ncbi:MAG TPA: galactokinase family protein, partial [Gaiellaceae bacterium]
MRISIVTAISLPSAPIPAVTHSRRNQRPEFEYGERNMSTRIFWAPGRVNLIGEFTDLVGGPVLPAALDLGVRIEAEAAETIDLCSHELGGRARLAADGGPLAGENEGWARYVAAVAAELALLERPAVGLEGE